MAGSTYSTNLKIELMTTGENSGTWGDITNTNLGTALEQAVIGLGNPDYTSDANLTISITNSNAAQAARALVLNVTSTFGSLTQTRELVVPTIQKQYIVQNNTTGGQSITVKTSAGTGITVPNGRKAHLYVNGTNVIQMFDFVNILGGTIDNTTLGATTASSARVTTLNASGATTLDGTVALGNAAGDLITVPGTINSNLIFTDNTYDIGASGATRPRNLFLAGAATIGGNLSVGGTLTLTGGVNLNGNVTVGDSAADTLTINSTVTSNLIFTDNTYDIGASGATRPRNLFIAGNITAGGSQTLTGALTVDSTTDSSSTTTGSIQTDGGLGVAKALYVGTTANIAGAVTLSGGTANGVGYLNASKVLTTGGTLLFNGLNTLSIIASTGSGTLDISAPITGNTGISNQIAFQDTGNTKWALGGSNVGLAAQNSFGLYNYQISSVALTIDIATNNWSIPTGTVTIAGAFTANGGAVFNENSNDVDFRVESDTYTHMLFVDAGTNTVGVGASITDVTSFGLIVGSNITADEGSISIARGSYKSSPTDIGAMYWFNGGDATERAKPLAGIWGRDEYTGTTYNGSLHLGTQSANNIYKRLSIEVTETVVNQDSLDVDFRVESDSNTHALFVDAGNSRVGVNLSNPSAPLQVYVGTTNSTALQLSGASAYTAGIGPKLVFQNGTGSEELAGIQGSFNADINGNYGRLSLFVRTSDALGIEEKVRIEHQGAITTYPLSGGNAVFNENGNDADFRVESDSNTHMLFVDAGSNIVTVALTSPVADCGALQIGAGGGTSSSIGINNSDNATISAKYGLVFQADNQDNIGSRFIEFRIGGKGYSDGRALASFKEDECVFNDTSRDQDFRVESDTNTSAFFVDAGLGTICVNGNGANANSDVAGFQNLSSNGSLSGGNGFSTVAFSRTQYTAATNNATVDAFRFLDHGNAVFATSHVSGSFYINVTGASGANQYNAIYNVLVCGNGASTGTSVFALETSVTRGTSPVSSIALLDDGSGGAVKVQITYINNSGVVTGGSSTITFVGQVSTT